MATAAGEVTAWGPVAVGVRLLKLWCAPEIAGERAVGAGGLKVSEAIAHRVLALPMHPYLQPEVQDRIIEAIWRLDALTDMSALLHHPAQAGSAAATKRTRSTS